jgi:hypothetical protein
MKIIFGEKAIENGSLFVEGIAKVKVSGKRKRKNVRFFLRGIFYSFILFRERIPFNEQMALVHCS